MRNALGAGIEGSDRIMPYPPLARAGRKAVGAWVLYVVCQMNFLDRYDRLIHICVSCALLGFRIIITASIYFNERYTENLMKPQRKCMAWLTKEWPKRYPRRTASGAMLYKDLPHFSPIDYVLVSICHQQKYHRSYNTF